MATKWKNNERMKTHNATLIFSTRNNIDKYYLFIFIINGNT